MEIHAKYILHDFNLVLKKQSFVIYRYYLLSTKRGFTIPPPPPLITALRDIPVFHSCCVN